MTDMDQLVVWLRETMNAAWRDAEEATPGPWTVRGLGRHDQAAILQDTGTRSPAGFPTGPAFMDAQGSRATADARHAARHNPASVLRRIAADRKTVDDCDDILHDFVFGAFRKLAEDTIRNLAEGYGWKDER